MSKSIKTIGLSLALLSGAGIALGQDWPQQRCDEIQTRLELLEGQDEQEAEKQNVRSAPLIRQEIAAMERELGLLQSFQQGSQTIQLSTIVNHVPGFASAVIGAVSGASPVLAEQLVHRTGDLQKFINQREIKLRQSELPRLKDEQTEVARQIFILRESVESLKCNERGMPGQLILGKWRASETGNVIEFVSGGNGFLRELGGASASFGFSPGDAVFTNLREVEDSFTATMVIRGSKQDCPTLEPITVNATIKIATDSRSFTLSAPGYNYCLNPCRWASGEGDLFDRTYVRAD